MASYLHFMVFSFTMVFYCGISDISPTFHGTPHLHGYLYWFLSLPFSPPPTLSRHSSFNWITHDLEFILFLLHLYIKETECPNKATRIICCNFYFWFYLIINLLTSCLQKTFYFSIFFSLSKLFSVIAKKWFFCLEIVFFCFNVSFFDEKLMKKEGEA